MYIGKNRKEELLGFWFRRSPAAPICRRWLLASSVWLGGRCGGRGGAPQPGRRWRWIEMRGFHGGGLWSGWQIWVVERRCINGEVLSSLLERRFGAYLWWGEMVRRSGEIGRSKQVVFPVALSTWVQTIMFRSGDDVGGWVRRVADVVASRAMVRCRRRGAAIALHQIVNCLRTGS